MAMTRAEIEAYAALLRDDPDTNAGQRALAAAEFISTTPGVNQHSTPPDGGLMRVESARLFGVSKKTLAWARDILARGTPEQIDRVRSGAASVYAVGVELGYPKGYRRQRDDVLRVNMSAHKEKTTEVNRMRAQLWGHLSEAFVSLAALPSPGDVVAIVRQYDHGGLTERRLDRSIKWLTEFSHAWKSSKDAAHTEQVQVREGDADGGARGGAA